MRQNAFLSGPWAAYVSLTTSPEGSLSQDCIPSPAAACARKTWHGRAMSVIMKDRWLDSGMDANISKPIRSSQLYEILERVLDAREAKGVLLSPRPEKPLR